MYHVSLQHCINLIYTKVIHTYIFFLCSRLTNTEVMQSYNQEAEDITSVLQDYLEIRMKDGTLGSKSSVDYAAADTSDPPSSHWMAVVTKTIIMSIISASIIATNLINLAVLCKMSQIPRVTRIFLLNLSVSDLLVGMIACAPASYTVIIGHWPYGDVWCQVAGVAHGTSVTISIWSISMVGVDRYIAVTRPFAYTTIVAGKKFYAILIALWLAAIVTFITPIFTKPSFLYYKYDSNTSMCGMYWEYRSYCIITGIYIPVLSGSILTFTSLRISKSLHDQRKQQHVQNSGSNRRDLRNASTKKTLTILLAASIVYFICWGPYVIIVYINAFGVLTIPPWLHFATTWLANSNSMMNVLIYSLTNKTFRDTLQGIVMSSKQNRVVLVLDTPPGDGKTNNKANEEICDEPVIKTSYFINGCHNVEDQHHNLTNHQFLHETIAIAEDSALDDI